MRNVKKNNKKNSDLEAVKIRIAKVLKKHHVRKAGIFGSFVRGEQKKDSDIDILVDIQDNKMSLLEFAAIKVDLEESLRRKVDLIEYKLIRPELRKNILEEEVRVL